MRRKDGSRKYDAELTRCVYDYNQSTAQILHEEVELKRGEEQEG